MKEIPGELLAESSLRAVNLRELSNYEIFLYTRK